MTNQELKRSKSTDDISKILPSNLKDQQIRELQSQLATKTQELDQSLFARLQTLKSFEKLYEKVKELKAQLTQTEDEVTEELLSQDQEISKLRDQRTQFKLKVQQLERDLGLAQRLAELRREPLTSNSYSASFLPYLIWPLTFILIYWMLKSYG